MLAETLLASGSERSQDDDRARALGRRQRLFNELGVRASVAVTILIFSEITRLSTGAGMSPFITIAALLALTLNIPYYFAAQTGWRLRAQAYGRMFADVGLFTIGLHGVGGLDAAPYASVYVIVPLYAGFALSSAACVAAAAVATLAYLALVVIQHGPRLPTFADPTWSAAFFNLLIVNIVGLITAILSAAYRRSRRQLLAVNCDLERAHGRVVEAERLRAVGELSAGVAHHLNNILAVVLGRVQIALGQPDDPAHVMRNLRIAEQSVLDASEVVRRMSAISPAEPMLEWAPVDLNELIRDVLELTRPRWESEPQIRGLKIDARFQPGPIPPVAAEVTGLREVLMNLVFNAVDALPQGGTITIRTWTNADGVFSSVIDTGIGMTPDVQRRALEPFFTTKGPRSTGLGLTVSYGSIRRMGGTFTIDSVEGAGTTVMFRLPPASPAFASIPAVSPEVRTSLRILLIDDDARVREAIGEMLTFEEHAVIHAASGPEGLAHLEGHAPIDLVLTDLGMPGMTGWDVVRAVKARYPSLPVGMITGWGDEPRARFQDQEVVADFVLAKPVCLQDLATALARWVSPPTPGTSAVSSGGQHS